MQQVEKEVTLDKDDLFQTLDRTNAWIENCDTKASIILGGIGVVFGIMLTSENISKIALIFKHMMDNTGFWTGLHIFLSVISICGIVVGALFLLWVLVGKTDTCTFASKGITSESLIFFSSVAKESSLQLYKSKLIECSESNWFDEIISQIFICSIICDKKFKRYKIGLILSVLGFNLFAVMMIIGICVL